MQSKKILTITVPSYHTERYIDECLPTLLNESINDKIEVIMVNDGSTDGTLEKARSYEKKFPNTIRVVDKQNGGHGSTINKGIELAKGKYFRVVDGDDWVNTQQLISLVNHLESLEADIVVSPYEDHNMDSGEVKKQDYANAEHGKIVSYDDLVGKANRLPMMHATTFKTNILKENNIIIDEKMFYVDMEYITFPIPYLATAVYLNYPVYCYRMGTAEQSVNPANFVKNREMHRKVTYRLVEVYNALKISHPNAERTRILRRQLVHYELPLDTNICLYMDDLVSGKKEFLSYRMNIIKLAPELWQNIPSKKVKLLSFANAFFFRLLSSYTKKKGIR
ncbi:glycosyltransferase family 2 protein [Exercitatus varius]|uniref:glycosyltransferase family 2 protein n=1 Tax=Exercitatus varius TaxID=67857 RepID=UPI00294AC979|nr:glycosyltransferase family 2 protein [Exercitatus varius]MDG2953758.1 glycosyltransferase family 2 protein [Exercitatus varius]MDG2957178.1 glycosyltransferase family 2 protein [Exercitatus varius]MDG2961795.1 glycosyltransferase family 2 protein [Exercitatus varius]